MITVHVVLKKSFLVFPHPPYIAQKKLAFTLSEPHKQAL